jgi:hypothetical protein
MFSGWYDAESKICFIQIDRFVLSIMADEFMDFHDLLGELQADMLEDPDLELGTYKDDDGNEFQEFVIKKKDEDYS